MKCFTTIVTVFVIGLLSCIYAQSISQVTGVTENVMKRKCDNKGVANQTVVTARRNFQRCISSLVNMNEIQAEMEAAKPKGELDEVFSKYCRKSSAAKKCMADFIAALNLCLDEAERGSMRIVQNITDSLLSFGCHGDGDRIALFIAEGGPDCISAKEEKLKGCFNTTFGSYFPATGVSSLNDIQSLPSFVLNAEICTKISTLQTCVVNKLEECDDPTTSNIVDSLVRYILKQTPCPTLTAGKSS